MKFDKVSRRICSLHKNRNIGLAVKLMIKVV